MASYYISASGNDSTANGSIGAPYRTIAKVNSLSLSSGDVVNFRGGDLFNDAILAPQSGTSGTGNKVTYQSYGTGAAILSGGVVVSGSWTNTTGNIWRISWSASNGRPRALYVDGIRCVRARNDVGLTSGAVATSGGYTTTDSYLDGEINPTDIEFVLQMNWQEHRFPVSSISGTTITMQSTAYTMLKVLTTAFGVSRLPTFVENAYGMFTANAKPGTFYQDRANNYLYVIPPVGISDPNSVTVIAPVRETIVNCNAVDHVMLRNLRIEHTTCLVPSGTDGYIEEQATAYQIASPEGVEMLPAAVTVIDGSDVSLNRVQFSRLGATGIIVKGTTNVTDIAGCSFHDISGSPVAVGHPSTWRTSDTPISAGVHSCIMYDYGKEFRGGVGVHNVWSSDFRCRYNHIHGGHYTGISHGWGWGDSSYVASNANSTSARIEYNHIHHIMRPVAERYGVHLNDGAGIYLNGTMSDCLVAFNAIHAMAAPGSDTAHSTSPALYCDNGNQNVTLQGNVLYEIGGAEMILCNLNAAIPTVEDTVSDIALTISSNAGGTPVDSTAMAVGLDGAIAAAASLGVGLESAYWDVYQYDNWQYDVAQYRSTYLVADDLPGADASSVSSWIDRSGVTFTPDTAGTLHTNHFNGHKAVTGGSQFSAATLVPERNTGSILLALVSPDGTLSGLGAALPGGWYQAFGNSTAHRSIAMADPTGAPSTSEEWRFGALTSNFEVVVTDVLPDGTIAARVNDTTQSFTPRFGGSHSGGRRIVPGLSEVPMQLWVYGSYIAEARAYDVVLWPSEQIAITNRLRFLYDAVSDASAPSTPTGLAVDSVTTSSITWSWTPVYGVAGYVVSDGTTTIDVGAATSYTWAGLPGGTSKTLTVKSYTAYDNESAASSGVSAATNTTPKLILARRRACV